MKNLLILIFLFSTCLLSFSNSPDHIISVIGEDTYVELKRTHEIVSILRSNEIPVLLPSVLQRNTILQKIGDLHPTIGVELLLLFKVPWDGSLDKSLDESREETRDNDQMPLAMYNVLRSISTLKGITYYSASRKKNHVLYSKAYIIDSPENKKRIKDPVFHSIPAQSEVYAFFKDSSLGEYTCRMSYLYNDPLFIMSMENITAVSYFLLPIVQPHGLLNYIIIIPHEEEIIFYGFSCLKVAAFWGAQEGKIDSLFNRLRAICQWFQTQYQYDE